MSWITSRRERWTWGNRTFMQPVYVHLPKLTEGYLFFFRIASWTIPIMSCYCWRSDFRPDCRKQLDHLCDLMRLRATLLAATRQPAPLPGLGGFLFAATRPSKARSKRWRTGNGEKMSWCMEMQNPWQDPCQLSKMHRPQDKSRIIFDAFRSSVSFEIFDLGSWWGVSHGCVWKLGITPE